jgi:hypothetical protein
MRQQASIGELAEPEVTDTVLTTWLTAPPVLSPGESDTLRIEVSVRSESEHSGFSFSIRDSSLFVLRDLSSGAMIQARSETDPPGGEPVFPIETGFAKLMQPAAHPEICPESCLPRSVIAGSDSVALMRFSVTYNSEEDHSSVWLRRLRVGVTDSAGKLLDPRGLLDRVGFRPADGAVSYQAFVAVESGYAVFELGTGGITIDPGNSVALDLVGDIEADTPFDHFVLKVSGDDGITISDATDPKIDLDFVTDAACASSFPFATGITRVYLPAGSPTVKPQNLGPQMAFPGRKGLVIFMAELAYNSSGPQADLVVDNWWGRFFTRTSGGLVPYSSGNVLDAVHMFFDDQVVASDTALSGDTLRLDVEEEYLLSRGSSKVVTLTCDVRRDAEEGNYAFEFIDSTFAQFLDHDQMTTIYPIVVGRDYPIRGAEVSIMAENLAGSFVNWPNPFNPRSEVTTIGFVLAEDAHVDIEIFTITGELVKEVVADSHRSAGSNQQDTWNGSNAQGQTVIPGTYFCRIKARYVSGKTEEATRRVAVIR